MKKDITSKQIGELVLRYLKKLDQVAYIRFASVYRDFQDLETFKSELEKLDDITTKEGAKNGSRKN